MWRTTVLILSLSLAASAAIVRVRADEFDESSRRLPFSPTDLKKVTGEPRSIGKDGAWVFNAGGQLFSTILIPSENSLNFPVNMLGDRSAADALESALLKRIFMSELFTSDEGETILKFEREAYLKIRMAANAKRDPADPFQHLRLTGEREIGRFKVSYSHGGRGWRMKLEKK